MPTNRDPIIPTPGEHVDVDEPLQPDVLAALSKSLALQISNALGLPRNEANIARLAEEISRHLKELELYPDSLGQLLLHHQVIQESLESAFGMSKDEAIEACKRLVRSVTLTNNPESPLRDKTWLDQIQLDRRASSRSESGGGDPNTENYTPSKQVSETHGSTFGSGTIGDNTGDWVKDVARELARKKAQEESARTYEALCNERDKLLKEFHRLRDRLPPNDPRIQGIDYRVGTLSDASVMDLEASIRELQKD